MARTKKLTTVNLEKGGGVVYKRPHLSGKIAFSAEKLFAPVGRPILLLSLLTFKVSFLVLRLIFVYLTRLKKRISSAYKRYSKRVKKASPPSLPQIHLPRIHFPRFSIIKLGLSLFLLFAVYSSVYFYLVVLKDLPNPESLATSTPPLTTKIYDRDKVLLYEIYRDQNRTLLTLDQIPQSLKDATIAIEDKDFYKHHGLSLVGIFRAAYKNITQSTHFGGSTITQQLVKNTLLTPERTYTRKLKEAVLALWVERIFTKDQILEMYLNRVGFGGSAYGVEAAAQVYFGKSADQLTLSESALLAGLPASPTTYSPFGQNPELATKRQHQVLKLMLDNHFIDDDQYEDALTSPIAYTTPKNNIKAPHFVMYVKSLLAEKYGDDIVENGGLEVITSLDLDTQDMAQEVVTREVESLSRLNIGNGAALVTKPGTGEILAMIGSKNYFDQNSNGNFNVTTALRQPGSSIKPIMYSYALEHGFTPQTPIEDSPVTFNIAGSPPYTPKNYDNRFHGRVTLRTALASSYNVPAVKILSQIGVNSMIDRGSQMGITTWNERERFGLSLTLGGGEVKMTDMAVAYGTIANLGKRVDLHPILKVTDFNGKTLEEYACSQTGCNYYDSQIKSFGDIVAIKESQAASPVINPGVAFQLINILSDNLARAPAFGTRSTLVIPEKTVAVKTGTSNNQKDNWTIGFTPNLLVATWVGNNDSSPMSYVASGVTGASPIWQKIMYQLIKDLPDSPYSPPGGLTKTEICGKTDYFLPGTEPPNVCPTTSPKPPKPSD